MTITWRDYGKEGCKNSYEIALNVPQEQRQKENWAFQSIARG